MTEEKHKSSNTSMSHAQHTPGPWELSEGNTSIWGISPLNARFRIASITHLSPMNCIDGHANARVVAAAPELLAALVEMEAVFGPGVDAYGDGAGAGEIDSVRNARTAIAKAKGAAV